MRARKAAEDREELGGTQDDTEPRRHLCKLEPRIVLRRAGLFNLTRVVALFYSEKKIAVFIFNVIVVWV